MLRQKKREELGVGLDDFCILSVGELNVNKNHQVIIRALKEMDDLKTKYFIAGKGEQKKKLDKLIKELGLSGKVKLLGFRRDIPELLRASDCFAFPSRREGLGIAAVEAMAAGVPLVTSASGGIKDYCISGITGYLSKKGTAEEYKSLLEQVKNCDEIQPANLKKYSSKFNENCVRKIMQSIYKGI
ncbi:glycosyltransferase [Lachnospiraceae bacterium 48-21]